MVGWYYRDEGDLGLWIRELINNNSDTYDPSEHGPCGSVLAAVWHILAILAYRYANNYRHWSSLGKAICAKWWSANNLQF